MPSRQIQAVPQCSKAPFGPVHPSIAGYALIRAMQNTRGPIHLHIAFHGITRHSPASQAYFHSQYDQTLAYKNLEAKTQHPATYSTFHICTYSTFHITHNCRSEHVHRPWLQDDANNSSCDDCPPTPSPIACSSRACRLSITHKFEHVPVKHVVIGEALTVEKVAEQLPQVRVVWFVVKPQ